MTEHYRNLMGTRAKRGMTAAILAVIISSGLAMIKLFAGIFGTSYALIADGIESCLDILGALIVYGGLRIAAHPPDENHPYGHGKAESLAGLAVGILLVGAALLIAVQSIREIILPHHAPRAWTLAVLIGVVAVKELLYRSLHRIGLETESTAMQADAWHHRSDALTSLAAFCGITLAVIKGPGWEAADDWAALAACGIILFNGIILLKRSAHEMMDISGPPDLVDTVRQTALRVPRVDAVETCMVRKSGPGWLVDIHILIEGRLSVAVGHEIAHEVKDALLQSDLGILNAQIHVEPHEAHPEIELDG